MNKYLIFLILNITIIITSCFTKINQTNNTPYQLWSEDKIDEFIVNWMVKNDKGSFDWNIAPEQMIYSALMHGERFLTIGYKLTPEGSDKPKYESSELILPKKWIAKRDELLEYLLEKEKTYRKRPELTIQDLLPWFNKKVESRTPYITLEITNPDIVHELRNNRTITTIEPSYHHRNHIIMEKYKERYSKGYRYKKQ